MDKSAIYRFAQLCVVRDTETSGVLKLEILRELQEQEKLALFVEEREKKESEEK